MWRPRQGSNLQLGDRQVKQLRFRKLRVRPAGLIIGKKSTGPTRGSCLHEAHPRSPYMPPTDKLGGYPFSVNGYFVQN